MTFYTVYDAHRDKSNAITEMINRDVNGHKYYVITRDDVIVSGPYDYREQAQNDCPSTSHKVDLLDVTKVSSVVIKL